MNVFLIKCRTEKLNRALTSLYTACLGVAATLKLEFAKTIALGVSIGNSLLPRATKICKPPLLIALPQEYHHWIDILINYSCKAIAMSIAWYIQAVISAYHSAIRGGLLCSRGLLGFAHDRGVLLQVSLEGYADEITGWLLAAMGLYFQIHMNFAVPFPLNLVLWPLELAEWNLRWYIVGDL